MATCWSARREQQTWKPAERLAYGLAFMQARAQIIVRISQTRRAVDASVNNLSRDASEV